MPLFQLCHYTHIHVMSSVSFTVLCVCVFVQMKSAGAGDEGLFTESYCNICNAQLISESQRVAHYEVSTHTHTQTHQ